MTVFEKSIAGTDQCVVVGGGVAAVVFAVCRGLLASFFGAATAAATPTAVFS